ncbi:tyrosine-type recombinase/integrase [Avibacterium paragallinarum]|uniref:Phage integrase family site-specific recombinase n=4 Tax=Avibacterium paragallinarum TaxID=728 RepID=A0A0F5ERZ1_AVIPA|nr:site-specific integrase [Avibacterium paragallinarum]AZI14473.1 site-specific integrase [Avibacterium paragallinarum]MEE3608303.1 tyrosine-type recombinase/integrase [Avibacterium paragallinarum]MEE3620774.1 tyrosine-type recombinase/integrase [Avibacterium paragallinarum]MEE3668075.1 tyrosine-type recombinase/integrase [Avibacterium paragallinarum]MEE3681347.1 tyrosine-type recombinase/integrase [Avibacterium paragallinarum]
MLTDTKIKSLKPKDKVYKVADRDGLYVSVSVTGTITFRYDYRINGRRETLTIGKYGVDGINLAEARERLMIARKQVSEGVSPARQKRAERNKIRNADRFCIFAEKYLADVKLADSTKALRIATYERDIKDTFGNRLMVEITTDEIRHHCEKIKDRGAPSTAIFVRDLIANIYRYAIQRGHKFSNPADEIANSSIAVFKKRERTLTPREIHLFFNALEETQSDFGLKKAVKFILLTLVRKGELINAKWDEIDFKNKVWTIPAERMKAKRAHNVYLSEQSIDLIVAFQIYSEGSPYLLPGRINRQKPIANSSLNRVIANCIQYINRNEQLIDDFTVHDLRRTGSTLLHEMGFNSDWIEKSLAHEQQGVRAVYNKAEYAEQRKEMLQVWADKVDEWIKGKNL